MSGHEGGWRGNSELTTFFAHLEARKSKSEIVFIRPSTPFLHLNETLISANPSTYPCQISISLQPVEQNSRCHKRPKSSLFKAVYAPGIVEFYFDSARTVMDLTLSKTIHNNPQDPLPCSARGWLVPQHRRQSAEGSFSTIRTFIEGDL